MSADDASSSPATPLERARAAAPGLSAGRTLVAAALAREHPATTDELAEASGVSRPTVNKALAELESEGLAVGRKTPVDERGRDPREWCPAGGLAPGVPEVDADRGEPPELREAVRALAEAHYLRGLSYLTSKRVARKTSIESTHYAFQAMETLEERGAVERVDPEGSGVTKWRLTGADEHAPFYAPE